MTSSVSVARRITQLIVAMSLITGLTVLVFLALPNPARAAVAQHSSTVAHTWSAPFGVNALVAGPQVICGSSPGGCP